MPFYSTVRSAIRSIATAMPGAMVVAGVLTLATACADRTPDGIVAQAELVQLELEHTPTAKVLRLLPAPGAQINAQFKPVITTSDGARLIFDSPHVTPDSEYFTAPPEAQDVSGKRMQGVLLSSVCPAGKKVCMTVKFPVDIR